MNYSDAERMSTILDSLGYTKTDNESEADLFIVISCSVRQSAIDRIYGKVRDLNQYKKQNNNLKTILTGCVLAKDQKKLAKVFDIMLEINELNKLPKLLGIHTPVSVISSVAEESLSSIPEGSLQQGRDDNYFGITPHYESTFRAYVPISTGCDNYCTYCAVPYTRGREKSRPMAEIIREIHDLVTSGYKEITLLGQNVNSYGNKQFVALLKQLDAIPGDHRIYFYSNHPKDISDELINTMIGLKHFPHYIHLPLQSGNDEIIRKMNRHYTKNQYIELVAKIRKAMPDITLTTDIIVGFPGETGEQFADTVDVMEKAEYDMAFIAQYSPREGTVSAKMIDDVSEDEKRRREGVLQKVLARTVLTHNKKLVDTTQRVLIDEVKKGQYFGRTEGFKVVEIKTDQPLQIGQFVDVKIESASSWKLGGCL